MATNSTKEGAGSRSRHCAEKKDLDGELDLAVVAADTLELLSSTYGITVLYVPSGRSKATNASGFMMLVDLCGIPRVVSVLTFEQRPWLHTVREALFLYRRFEVQSEPICTLTYRKRDSHQDPNSY